MKVLILIGSLFTVLLSQNIIKKLRYRAYEYYSILLIATFSSMCLIISNDFVPLFVAMETLSVSCCLLIAYWNKFKPKEAALKFLINSSVATAFMLFGFSLLYGISGEMNFSLLKFHYYGQDTSILFVVACLFISVGLMFKTGCIPFQRWVPDVYQGSPYPISAFLSFVPKIAGFAILARLIANIMSESPVLQIIISIIAILTISYGMFGAIRQTDIKRLFGYSSVAHCGFMLLSLSVFSNYGIASFVYYAIVYLFMTFGAWAAGITFVACTGSDNIKDYKGLFYVRPYYTTAFVISLMALAGLPPTAGFLAKLYLFCSVMRIDSSGLLFLFLAMLLTVVGLYFYVNLIRIMFDKNKTNTLLITEQMNTKIVLYFCTLMLIFTCFFANQIIWLSMYASIGV